MGIVLRLEKSRMKDNIWKYAYFSVIFIFFFIFFSKLHPLVPYDGDDWRYLGFAREAIPLWKDWNPTRVLPEILMPLMGYVAAYLIFPVNGDYIHAVTISSSLFLSFFITVYLWMFSRYLHERFSIGLEGNLEATTLFITFHFLIFSYKINPIPYLFGMINLTCVFYYLIPALVNNSVVFYLLLKSKIFNSNEKPHKWISGFFILSIYLSIFSNLFQSIILASYVVSILLFRLPWKTISLSTTKKYILDNRFFVGIFVLWLISLLYEANGGRAHSVGNPIHNLPIKETILYAWGTIKHFNISLLFLALLNSMGAHCIYFRKQSRDIFDKAFITTEKISVISLVITIIFLG